MDSVTHRSISSRSSTTANDISMYVSPEQQTHSDLSDEEMVQEQRSDSATYESDLEGSTPSRRTLAGSAHASSPRGLEFLSVPLMFEGCDAEDTEEDRQHFIEDLGQELAQRLDDDAEATRHDSRNLILTEEDRDNICAFRLRFLANVSRATYDKFRDAFRRRLHLNSDWVILHRIIKLSGVKPVWYECCINSCVCYLADLAEVHTCPECQEPRYTPSGLPQRYFCYLPLIPFLQALYQSPTLSHLLRYRATFRNDADVISDIFSCGHYTNLRQTRVVVDDVELGHRHFSDPRDIAFALCTDSYLLFKRNRSGPSATPILLLNYNLPPDIRTHLEHLICLGVIGGPKQPKRIKTFLVPFEDECAQLAHGVSTYDCLSRKHFLLHGYCIHCLGDIIAIQKMLNIRGVNALVPCRSCLIRGTRIPGMTNYYIPLTHPHRQGQPPNKWDPTSLPLRTHEETLDQIQQLLGTSGVTYRDRLGQHYGIRSKQLHNIGPAIGYRVQSCLDYARSFPWDWMHLICENNIPNLVTLWMGRFKGLDDGTGNFIIPELVWQEIAQETRDAVKTIPSSFVDSIPDLITGRDKWTAEIWAFWFVHIAPIVLRGRFQNEKYYKHMLAFIEIIRTTLQFEVTRTTLVELKNDIILWVEQYEKYYYQYDTNRLSTCLLVVHGLLHIVDDILYAGPSWTTWTFFMERFCGKLHRALMSRSSPWTNLDRRVTNIAHAAHLSAKYDVEHELGYHSRADRSGPTDREVVLPGYPLSYLHGPCLTTYTPCSTYRRAIAKHLVGVVGGKRSIIQKALPDIIPAWGKVRIGHGGDSIRAMLGSRERMGAHERDSSYVRYESVEQGTVEVHYGRLLAILQLDLDPTQPCWKKHGGTILLLALITPCKTHRKNAAETLTLYDQYLAETIVDLNAVQAVVGRVRSRRSWGIIDRSNAHARTIFTTAAVSDDDNPEDAEAEETGTGGGSGNVQDLVW